MRPEMTNRQRLVLKHVIRSIQKDGYPPTVSEIQAHFRFSSPNGVWSHLKALERKGYLSRRQGVARGIQLAEGVMPSPESTPIVGRCAAGKPILVEENVIGAFSMAEMFGARQGTFMLRVEGDSMKDAHIFDGDYVVVKQQPQVDQGQVGVAITKDGATVKRIFDEGPRFRLQPANDEMKPLYVEKTDPEFRIAGKVVGVMRKL